jgi:hypothetical protein
MVVGGQLHGPAALPPSTHWIGGWVGPKAVLEAVVKRKIPNPRRKLKPRTPIVQPVAQSYTDWAIMALLMNREAQFRVALKRYLNTHSFYSVEEFLTFKNYSYCVHKLFPYCLLYGPFIICGYFMSNSFCVTFTIIWKKYLSVVS